MCTENKQFLLPTICLLLLGIMQCACSIKPFKKPLNVPAAKTIKQTRIISHIDQDDLYAQFDTQYTKLNGGFLLGSLAMMATTLVTSVIDYNVSKKNKKEAKAAVTPILDSLKRANIGAILHASLHKNMWHVRQLPIRTYEAFKNDDEVLDYRLRSPIIANSPEDSVLILTSNYSLTPDFRALNITTVAQLFTKDHYEIANGVRYYTPIYINKLIYQSEKLSDPALSQQEAYARIDNLEEQYHSLSQNTPLSQQQILEKEAKQAAIWQLTELSSLQKKEISALAWAKNDGQLIKNMLRKGAKQVMKMINMDLADFSEYNQGAPLRHDVVLQQTANRIVRRKMTGKELGILFSTAINESINIGGIVYEPLLLP